MKAKHKILFCLELFEQDLGGLEMVEDIISYLLILWAVGGRSKFLVLIIQSTFAARQDLLFAITIGPEVYEVSAHFFEQVAVVCGSLGIDDIVDARLGDDEGVTEPLTFGAFLLRCRGVLTAVVRGNVTDDVRVSGFAENQIGFVVFRILLQSC